MYLRKLDLHGFKSFADRTEVLFDPGVTAIVGPNGCGKSNIIDAVRWVLGEQRARMLRSERMENVIFNGTGKRRPLGLAEVSLTVENTRNVLPTQYTEVEITRRLYRSGESEYLLNKTPCRLRDIVDLFMDTGMGANAYSVIELKMTEQILSDNVQDRRRLFEEAAGITKYKLRRTQALRKLKGTQADLNRLRDLVEEIDKQVRSLARQARKAAQHKQMTERQRRLDLQLAQAEYTRLTAREAELKTESRTLQDRIEGLTSKQTGEEADIEALRLTLIERERALAVHQHALNDHIDLIRNREADLRLEHERAESAARNLDRAERERIAAENQRALLEQHLDLLGVDLKKAGPRLEQAREAREQARTQRDTAQTALDEGRATVRQLRDEEEAARRALAGAQNTQVRLQNRQEWLEQQQTEAGARDQALADTLTDIETRLQAAEIEVETARSRADAGRN